MQNNKQMKYYLGKIRSAYLLCQNGTQILGPTSSLYIGI